MNKQTFNTLTLVKMAILTATSIVLVLLIRLPFPPAPFLVYDPADIPIYITAFAFGPVSGIIVTFLVSFIQAFLLGGDGIYGFLMHFFATGAFAILVGAIYHRNKNRRVAILSIILGIIAATVIMVIMNLVITPIFLGAPRQAVINMIIPVIMPFNLLKAGVNGFITFILYKRVSGFLHNERRKEQ